MLYLKKPIPCYYLVYVEVAAPYRNRGLGNRILTHFAQLQETRPYGLDRGQGKCLCIAAQTARNAAEIASHHFVK